MKAIGYLEEYKSKQLKDRSPHTVSAYVSDLRHYLIFTGKDMEASTNEDIEAFKQQLLSQNLKPHTVNRKLVSIRKFIEYLHNYTDIHIYVEVKLIKIQRQEYLEEVLSKSEFDRIVRAAEKDKRALAVFYGLYLTGARVSELLQWKVKDIRGETINVRGKGGKYRDLFRSDTLKQYLYDYVGSRDAADDDYIFINGRSGQPMSRVTVHNIIKKYAGRAKVKLSKAHAHNFRHLCAFRLLEEGLLIDEVADILGHTDINTTRIYTRKTKSELMKAMNRLR